MRFMIISNYIISSIHKKNESICDTYGSCIIINMSTTTMTTTMIGYARISSNTQTQSLFQQISDLKTAGVVNIISDIGTVRDGMLTSLTQSLQTGNENKINKIDLYVSSIDRITRNVKDVGILSEYVENIYVVRENDSDNNSSSSSNNKYTRYNMKQDITNIVDEISSAHQEILTFSKRTQRSFSQSSSRPTNSKMIYAEKIRLANLRVNTIYNIFASNGISSKYIDNVRLFIQQSQQLESLLDWNTISAFTQQIDIDIKALYPKYINTGVLTRLSRKDVYNYASQMFLKNAKNVMLSATLIKEFVNAILHEIDIIEEQD